MVSRFDVRKYWIVVVDKYVSSDKSTSIVECNYDHERLVQH